MEPSGMSARDCDVGLEPLDAPPSHQLSRAQENYMPYNNAKYGNDTGENRAESLPSHSNISPMPRYRLRPSDSNYYDSHPETTPSSLLVLQPYGGVRPTAPSPITRAELLRRTHAVHATPPTVTDTSISNKSRVSSLIARLELTAKEILEQEGHSTIPTTIDVHLSAPDIPLSRNKNHQQIQQKIALYNNHKPLEAIQDPNDSNNATSAKESIVQSILLCGAVPLPHLRGRDREIVSDKDKVQLTSTIDKPADETTLVQNTSRSVMEFSLCGGGIDDTIASKETTNVIQIQGESPFRSITKISSTPVDVVRMDPVLSGQPGWQCSPAITRHYENPQGTTICTSTMMNQDMTSPMSDETRRRRRGEARNPTPVFSQKYISTTTSATADDSFISESYVEDDNCLSSSSCSDTSAAATGGTSKRRKLILSSKSRDDDDNAAIATKSVSCSPTVDSMGREYDVFADLSVDLANDDDDGDDSRDDVPEETGATKGRLRVEVKFVVPDRYASPGDHAFLQMEDNDRNHGQEVLFAGMEHQLPLENPDVWASPSNPTRVAYRREPGHSPTITVPKAAALPLNELLSSNMDSDWDVSKRKSRDVQTKVLAQRSKAAEQELRSIGSNPPAVKRKESDAITSYEETEIGISQTFPPFAKNTNAKSSRDLRPISPESNYGRSLGPPQKCVEEGVASTQEAGEDRVDKELANVATSKSSTRRSPHMKMESSAHPPQQDGTKVATSKKSKSRSPKKKRESTTMKTLEDATKICSEESKSRSPQKKRVSKTCHSAEVVTTVQGDHGASCHRVPSNTNDQPTSLQCETLAPATLSEERDEDGLDVSVPAKSSCEVLKFQVRKDVALRPQLQSVLDEIQRRRAERQSASMLNRDEEKGTKQQAEALTTVDGWISTEAISKHEQCSPVLSDSGQTITEPNRACDPTKSKVFKSAFDEYDRVLDQLLRQNKSLKQGESASQTSLGDDSGILRDRIAWIRRERDQAIDLYDFSLDDALETRKEISSDQRDDEAEYTLKGCRDEKGLQTSSSRGLHRSKSCPPAHAASSVEEMADRSKSLSPTKSRRNPATSPIRGCGTPEMGQQKRQVSPPKTKVDTRGVFQPRFQTPTQGNSRTYDYRMVAPSPTKTSPARLPFLAKLEEMIDRPPRVVSIEVQEPRIVATTTIDCDDDARQACSPQQQRQRRPTTTTTTAAKSPKVLSPERKRRSGPKAAEASSSEYTRRLRRQLDLARLTNLAIRNSNQSLSLELEAFKQRLWQHRNCARGERDILEACQYQLGSFQRHLEDKRKLPQPNYQHPFWSHNKSSTHYQESKSSSEESGWEDFSNIQGAMLANLELMRSARASMVGKVYCTSRHGGDEKEVDEDTARLREVIAMMKRV